MYTLIEHRKLSGTTASISFSSIPQIYTDLYLVLSASTNRNENVDIGRLAFNGTTGNWSNRQLIGFGSGNGYSETGSSSYGIFYGITGNAASTNTFGNTAIYIPNYTASTAKSVSMDWNFEANVTGAWNGLTAALWNQSASISSIELSAEFGSFVQYSSATLYGITRTTALGRPKAIGGNITFANGYWVHTFTGSGTFSAQQSLDIDALVVAGGGGGGAEGASGGGGGAGGILAITTTVPKGSYPVLVGAGGSAGSGSANTNTNGFTSSFLTLAPIGGGFGGNSNQQGGAGASGGGGGGSFSPSPGSIAAGLGTTGQGNNGGTGRSASNGGVESGGGGGGAGAIGSNASDGAGGTGGIGIVWNSTYYAGGGGGADRFSTNAGGLGGGGTGAGSNPGNGTAGTANTGGGGGGGASGGTSGAGGSGVVIIRYRAD
jgi:hypothetical protein